MQNSLSAVDDKVKPRNERKQCYFVRHLLQTYQQKHIEYSV